MTRSPLKTLGIGLAALAALGLPAACGGGGSQPAPNGTVGTVGGPESSDSPGTGAVPGSGSPAPGEVLDARTLAERVIAAMTESGGYRMEIVSTTKSGDQVHNGYTVVELDLSDPMRPLSRATSENDGQTSEMIRIGADIYIKQPGSQTYTHSTVDGASNPTDIGFDQVFAHVQEVKLVGRAETAGQQVTHYTLSSAELITELFVDDGYRIVHAQSRVSNAQVETDSDMKVTGYGKRFGIEAPDPAQVTEG